MITDFFNVQGALEQARAIKQQGNDFFKQQKYEEAIRCYQEAIKVCPVEKKEDMAIFHQNIGAVYDQMVSGSKINRDSTWMNEREGERERRGRMVKEREGRSERQEERVRGSGK